MASAAINGVSEDKKSESKIRTGINLPFQLTEATPTGADHKPNNRRNGHGFYDAQGLALSSVKSSKPPKLGLRCPQIRERIEPAKRHQALFGHGSWKGPSRRAGPLKKCLQRSGRWRRRCITSLLIIAYAALRKPYLYAENFDCSIIRVQSV